MLQLVNYSEKSIALFGEETKDLKERLADEFNGVYNRFLKDPDKKGETRKGWIFAIKHKAAIEKLVAEINNSISGKKTKRPGVKQLVKKTATKKSTVKKSSKKK